MAAFVHTVCVCAIVTVAHAVQRLVVFGIGTHDLLKNNIGVFVY